MAGRRVSGSSNTSNSPCTTPRPLAADRGFGQSPRSDVTGKAFLCGRVGYGVRGSFRKDILFRYLEKRDAIGPDVEVTADHSLFNRQHAATVTVVIRVPAFECAVDEEGDGGSQPCSPGVHAASRATIQRHMASFVGEPVRLGRLPRRQNSRVCASCHRRTPLCALLYDSQSICCLPALAYGGPPPPPESGRPQGSPLQDDGE